MGSPITFSGFNSIDFNQILNAVMAQERAPLNRLETQKRTLESQNSAFATLADIIFRRTGIGEPPGPSLEALDEAARFAGEELGWDDTARQAEIDDVLRQAGGPAAARRVVTG